MAHAAFIVNMGVENIAAYKIALTFALLPHSYLASFICYVGINCALVAVAAALVNYAAPAAAGSGIPEVKVRREREGRLLATPRRPSCVTLEHSRRLGDVSAGRLLTAVYHSLSTAQH